MLQFLSSLFSRLTSALKSIPSISDTLDMPSSQPVLSPESSSNQNSTLRAKLTEQLRRDEGEVLHAYEDHLGYLTIGIGRLIDRRKGGGISQEESAYLFGNDLNRILADVKQRIPWFDRLDEARQGVLVNMAFQMGVEGLLGFKNTLSMIERGDYDAAADGMLNSLWARQTPARARRLAIQMRTGQWQ